MVCSANLEVIFGRTERALTEQRVVPVSPGRLGGNGPLLCAGAMLVHEALAVLRSPAEACQFAHRVVCEESDFIVDTAGRIGLDRAMVAHWIIANDSLGQEDRLQGVLRSVRRLRETLRAQFWPATAYL